MLDKKAFPIVGIGASAGGLEPLEVFFENISLDSGFAFVVIQHLAPNHKSLMDELLARHTKLPIKVIEQGMRIKQNCIYLNPPKVFVEIQAGRFVLSEKEDRKLSFPISTFFESLSLEKLEMAAAVVLSGTGSDGSEGIKYIKERGGLVLAQDPNTAKFDGMPKNAINTGSVDKICMVEELPGELHTFFKNSTILHPELEDNQQKETISEILRYVDKHTGVDFADYKTSTIYRRTIRRMGIMGFAKLEDYCALIKRDNSEGHKLASELLIGVTRFFRDEEAFAALREQVVPKLFEQNKETKTIRVWVTACSTGEEAYSIAILLCEYQRQHKLRYDITIFATDLDMEAIKMASNRFFPDSIANEVPPNLLSAYFVSQKQGFAVVKEIREKIVFSVHNLIQDPPFGKIDLLSCRNFLIYLTPVVQQRVFALFQFALKEKGYLFLGSSESLGAMGEDFEDVNAKYKLFSNKHSRRLVQLRGVNKRPQSVLYEEAASGQTQNIADQNPTHHPSKRMLNEIQELIIQEFSPDTIVFSDRFELVHTTGRVTQWLRMPPGGITTNVVSMLPESLRLSFELMATKALNTGEAVSLTNVAIDGLMQQVYVGQDVIQVQIKKLPSRNGLAVLAATFLPVSDLKQVSDANRLDLGAASKEKINTLERELRVNQENLQTTIEELESSNEELQASNEELQSSNEELESVNEELYTVNSEFQEKVNELSDSNNDLNNLIQSTDIAILFLDSKLNIRKFTPSIRPILNLLPQDVGRHISHFRSKLQVEDFISNVEKVFEDLRPYETITRDQNGNDYLMRLSPFRTAKKEIKGVVISFIDISATVSANRKLELSEEALTKSKLRNKEQTELFEIIANNSSDIISLNSLDGSFEYVSPACLDLTGFGASELHDGRISDLIPHKRHVDLWKKALVKLANGKHVGLLRFLMRRKDGQERWFESSVKQVTERSGEVTHLLITTRDIHNRVEMEVQLNELAIIVAQTKNAILVTDTEERIKYINRAMEEISGYSEEELLGKKPGEVLQGKETNTKTVKSMSTALQKEKKFSVDVLNYTKKGTKYWVNINSEPVYDLDGDLSGFVSIQHDVTLDKDYEQQISRLNEMLRDQNNRLTELNKSLEEFAYIASHDLKTPLRNIRSMMDLIIKNRDNADKPRMDKYFGVMRNAVVEMNTLIENLLEYSRSGSIAEEKQQMQASGLIEEVSGLFYEEMEEMGGKITAQIETPNLHVYPILFKRMLTNLLSNAIKYRAKEPPLIEIKLQKKEEKHLLRVKDNGMGIEENQQENIFQIFSSTGLNKDSNGIGLAVCRNIAQHHNGRIWVESGSGKGSTFIVEFEGG